MLLAIDTATKFAGIALYDGDAILLEQSWRSNQNHTVELMPSIVRALAQQETTVWDLRGLAVALGPGSFTGLRIGLSVAKGIAYVTGKPLLGIPTLDILGYACAQQDMRTCAVIQAGRGRYCTATYRRSQHAWERLDEYRILSEPQLIATLESPTLVCGELTPSLRDALQQQSEVQAFVASPAGCLRRAGYLAELGWQRLQRGERDNLATLSPIYLHNPALGANA